jgi:hypothetical protein
MDAKTRQYDIYIWQHVCFNWNYKILFWLCNHLRRGEIEMKIHSTSIFFFIMFKVSLFLWEPTWNMVTCRIGNSYNTGGAASKVFTKWYANTLSMGELESIGANVKNAFVVNNTVTLQGRATQSIVGKSIFAIILLTFCQWGISGQVLLALE